jgi:ABC-type glycerol-3-phosphate transport system substrate-binding protein
MVGKPINRLRMVVAQAGIMTYGKWDLNTTFTKLGTLELSGPGLLQIFEIPAVTLQKGETFAFHDNGDTGLFSYSKNDDGASAYFWRLVTGEKAHDKKNLGIDIGYCAE